MPKGLTEKQEKFCQEFIIRRTAIDAYRAAGYKIDTSKKNVLQGSANRLHNDPAIQARIRVLEQRATERAAMKIADVMNRWTAIALADPNDLVQVRRVACRFCYGENHRYQGTESEYALQCAKARDLGRNPPAPPEGGFGYNATLEPVATCPECWGEGEARMHLADTRNLAVRSHPLYAGAKYKKDGGIEIIFHDQKAALQNIAEYLGMFKTPLETVPEEPDDMPSIRSQTNDPVQAAKIYQQYLTGNVKNGPAV